MSTHLYIEGSRTGANSKSDQIRCREGFRKLIEKAGFSGKMPRLSACGGRGSAFDDFKTAHTASKKSDFVAMLIDSEDPMSDVEKPWEHLKLRDGWDQPDGSVDEQVLMMTTCMETWIAADRVALKNHYDHQLQDGALPVLFELESKTRHDLLTKLEHATRNCSSTYSKGRDSFEILGTLNPETLKTLPSFARVIRILTERL